VNLLVPVCCCNSSEVGIDGFGFYVMVVMVVVLMMTEGLVCRFRFGFVIVVVAVEGGRRCCWFRRGFAGGRCGWLVCCGFGGGFGIPIIGGVGSALFGIGDCRR